MKWFSIRELTKSNTAYKYKIDNTPSEQQKKYIEALIDNVLDPIREEYGKPVYVNSGFRCRELNKKVGGVDGSHHLCENGYAAADITARSKEENKLLFGICIALNLPFCQLIDESNFSWIHVSYNEDDVKREILHL